MCISTSLNTADFVNRVDQAHRLHRSKRRNTTPHRPYRESLRSLASDTEQSYVITLRYTVVATTNATWALEWDVVAVERTELDL